MARNLYTRCPNCKSELSFTCPDNMDQLPEDYRHTINCPNCGISIGVKLNKVDRSQDAKYTQEGPVNFMPTTRSADDEITYGAAVPPAQTAKAKPVNPIGRNLFMLITSLVFIVMHILGYLATIGKLGEIAGDIGFEYFEGVVWIAALIQNSSNMNVASLIVAAMEIAMFAIPCICFIISFIGLLCKKYGAVFHLVMTVLELLLTVAMLVMLALGGSILSLLLSVFLVQPVLAIIQLIVTSIFCARRAPKAKRK